MGFFDNFPWSKKKRPDVVNSSDVFSKAQEEMIERILKESNTQLLLHVAKLINDVAEQEDDLLPVIPETFSVPKVTDEHITDIRMNVQRNAEEIANIEKRVGTKLQENSDTLNAFIEVVSERVTNEKELADCFKNDVCPFNKKYGKCQIWMNRPVKNDAPNYCAPCQLQRELANQGL